MSYPLSYNPSLEYSEQLTKKHERLVSLLSPFFSSEVDHNLEIECFSSPEKHYRMRAEFRIWHEGDELFHIMFDQQTKERIKIEHFPVASELINTTMALLLPELKKESILRFRLFQIDYLSTLSGEILVSLLYHKSLDEDWLKAISNLKTSLTEKGLKINFVGRAHKQKFAVEQDYVDEELTVNNKKLIYRQIENSFTQPNAYINQQMLQWAVNATEDSKGSLLELYCGNGNFSVALAQNFRQVLATEIAKSSVAAAQFNISANKVENLTILRLSAQEFTQAINRERTFNRSAGIDLNDFSDCETVLVDPPRAGLDDATISMIQGYKRIIYISCNPETLVANLQSLTQTHSIEKVALFDQFPFTHHIETGVILEQR